MAADGGSAINSGRSATVTWLPIVRGDGSVRVGPFGTVTRLTPSATRSTRPRKEIRRAEKVGDEARYWPLIDLGWGADLLDPAVTHEDNAVGHRQRLVLVVGDEDRCDAEPLLQPAQFRLHALAQALVERSERLVEQ